MGKISNAVGGAGGKLRIEGPEVDIEIDVKGDSIRYAIAEKGALKRDYFGPLREVTVHGGRISCYAPLFSPYRSIRLSDRNLTVESAARSMDASEIIESYRTVLDSIAERFKSEFSAARSFTDKEKAREKIEALERLRSNLAAGKIADKLPQYGDQVQQAMDMV